MFMTHQYNITSVIKFDGFTIQSHEDNSDSTRAFKSGKIQMLPDAYVKRGTERNNKTTFAERNNKTTTQRYIYTASINAGSINYMSMHGISLKWKE